MKVEPTIRIMFSMVFWTDYEILRKFGKKKVFWVPAAGGGDIIGFFKPALHSKHLCRRNQLSICIIKEFLKKQELG